MTRASYPFFIPIIIAPLMQGCGIYQNEGRKSFESRSSGSLRTNVGIACWEQPADQALWHFETHLQLNIQKLPNNQLQVCVQEATP